jgi:hypothetical protein
MPAAAAAVQAALASGVRYIYTPLPAILASGAGAYFRSAKPSG